MLIRFPEDALELNAEIPVNLWDPKGVLLLRKGELIQDKRHREHLLMHTPMVDDEEYRSWTYRYTMQLDRMVRNNQSLSKIASVSRPMGVADAVASEERASVPAWSDLQATLTTLLHQNLSAHDFVSRLIVLEQRMGRLLQSRVDDSLFVLVQLLFDRSVNYGATHALLCSVACHLVGPLAGVPSAEQPSLCRAALTMNIGMARLHDALSRHEGALTAEQSHAIRNHPTVGANLLRRLGVGDALWLQLVEDHHEAIDGQGYPAGKMELGIAAQLLRLVDVFVARISPRSDRPGLLPQVAARNIYLGPDGQPSALGGAFVKTMGLYIPGSYVRLANGEVAVVVRRGRRANTPLVFVIIRQGMPLGEPVLRDTQERGFEVKCSEPADDVKVRLNAEKLLGRL
ncbi:MAG TPA: HD domain-containing phosphohydrolase [Macromonas sp.]|nr:HD domain-containing phosphohydrolase [Macromonas sp.]